MILPIDSYLFCIQMNFGQNLCGAKMARCVCCVCIDVRTEEEAEVEEGEISMLLDRRAINFELQPSVTTAPKSKQEGWDEAARLARLD